jgi:negative elongation factor C/D
MSKDEEALAVEEGAEAELKVEEDEEEATPSDDGAPGPAAAATAAEPAAAAADDPAAAAAAADDDPTAADAAEAPPPPGADAASDAAAPPLGADPAARLNALEALLRRPDGIMEPGALESLRAYVLAGGNPVTAVELLADGYAGYAAMAALAAGWLRLADEGEEGGGGGGGGQRSKRARVEEPDAPDGVPNSEDAGAARFLRALALERFDPARFAGVFAAGGGGAPRWVDALAAEPAGRRLIYALAARHPGSLLLNFAVQKVLSEPGREAEVAAAGAGGALVGLFGVFHRLLAARLCAFAAAPDGAAAAALAAELAETCARAQHAHAHARLVLEALAADGASPAAPRFRRLAQEADTAAAAAAGPAAWRAARWFAPPGAAAAAAAAAIADVLAAAAGAGAAPSSDIIKLARLYFPPPPGEGAGAGAESSAAAAADPPPVELLRHPRLIEVLLGGLFTAARPPAAEAAAAAAGLLAAAAAAPDDAVTSAPAVAAARAALAAAAAVGHKALRDERLAPAEAAALEGAAAALPAAGRGLLALLRGRLAAPAYWEAAYHVHEAPPFLDVLHALVRAAPGLHGEILTLVGDALAAMGHAPAGPHVARGLADVALALAAAGRAGEVAAWAEAFARRGAAAPARHLVLGLLARAAPPYDPAWAAALLRALAAAGVRRQRVGAREWAARAPLLAEFAAGAAALEFRPPLGPEDAAYLRELRRSAGEAAAAAAAR